VLTPASGFAIDGDLVSLQPAPAAGDWVETAPLAGSGQGVLAADGTPLNPVTTFHFIDPYDDRNNDLIFGGGSKWTGDPNSWTWTRGKPSAKADINNVLLHVASDDIGHTWLLISADRFSTQGESYIDFELLQNPLIRTNGGAFVSAGPHGGRTTNDLVLSLAFAGGGKVADFLVWRWEADGLGGYDYVDITSALPTNRILVALNTNTIASPYPVFGTQEYPPNAFAEAAIDLTAMINGVEACESFGFVAILVKTKASTSDAAGIEDFLDPIAYDFRIGPLADAGSDQMRCADALGTEFALNGTASAGLADVVSTQWSLVSGSATLLDPNALNTTVQVTSPAATLRLTVTQLNGCTDVDDVVLSTVPPPSVAIGGPEALCPEALAEFTAPVGLESYQWALTGNGTLVGPTNQGAVSVRAGSVCGEPLVLTLTGSSNICTVIETAEIPVIDEIPPVLSTGPDRTVECGTAWSFDPVSAVDACSGTNVLIQEVGTVTNALVGQTFRATRTWRATDACGNASLSTQTVTLVDTTPPQIICSTNVVVECLGPSGTEASFLVLASDGCDTNVSVVCTPPSGSAFPFGVTEVVCTATDDSGNMSQCSFLVTVQDTTPPEISCPGDFLRNTDPGVCEAILNPGLASASDVCGGVTVVAQRSDGLTLTNAYPKGVTLITWTATDQVGLTNSCTQVITIVDNESPEITCPPDLLAAEWPRDSGSATVQFDPPVVSDNCSEVPVVVCDPPPGSVFPVGRTEVRCVATDAAGNTNSCTFTVDVIPYRVEVVEVTDTGPGGLRDALLTANALPGETVIEFNIPGPGPYRIRPETNFPVITGPVLLDGRTQPGFADAPIIELDGTASDGSFDGLVFQSESNGVLAVSVYGFKDAIVLGTNTGKSLVQGCFLGVAASGTNVVGNQGDGLRISSAGNLVGGATSGDGNLIAGNRGNGIRLVSSTARHNTVAGNFIGVGLDGITPMANGGSGILMEEGAANNTIGSTTTADANRIAFNGDDGVTLSGDAGSGNTIGINSLDDNVALGIDLGNDGVTENDGDDSDTGPNQFQNFPVLTDARSVDGITTVDGSLVTRSNQTYRVDFYLNDTADPSGHGEGAAYLGFATVFVGATGIGDFSASFLIPAVFTQSVTATATDPLGNTSEFSEARQVRTPAVAEKVPSNTNVVAGSTVTLCADGSGTPPIFYQWRLNGANIPGETNQCITLTAIQAENSGAYSVIIYNDLGGVGSDPAALLVPLSNSVPAFDDFEDRQSLGGRSGLTEGATVNATREPGEPFHAGRPGANSVWYSWVAPETGIATLGTRGSSFDTLLGVYQGSELTNLTTVISDEDRGGFFTSGVRFNAFRGKEYIIAIDGYAGDSGTFVFGWDLEKTAFLLPRFTLQPDSQTVSSGGSVLFTSGVQLVCGRGGGDCPDPSDYPGEEVPTLEIQWYFQGGPVTGATNEFLTVSNVQPAHLGRYWVEATAVSQLDDGGEFVRRTIRSDAVDLQINLTGQNGLTQVQASDKFQDTLLAPPWVIGGLVPPSDPASVRVSAASGLSSGYTGTQIFSTVGSSSSSGETLLCGVPGGSSEWITLVSEAEGLLTVNTEGSDYDTVIAIYILTATNPIPQQIACNNDASALVTYSSLEVPVQVGDTNTILVDGVNGASGTLVLNYSLIGAASTVRAGSIDASGAFTVQVVGYPGMRFTLECSANLLEWTPLITTTSEEDIFSYTDTAIPVSGGKYYRAVFLP
jgi:hypothetical protein